MTKQELLDLHADCGQCQTVRETSGLSAFTVAKMHEGVTKLSELSKGPNTL